jgi:hypothetical protein
MELSQILPHSPLPLAYFKLYSFTVINYNCDTKLPVSSESLYNKFIREGGLAVDANWREADLGDLWTL